MPAISFNLVQVYRLSKFGLVLIKRKAYDVGEVKLNSDCFTGMHCFPTRNLNWSLNVNSFSG